MLYNPYQLCLHCNYKWKSHIRSPKSCPRCKMRKIKVNDSMGKQAIIDKMTKELVNVVDGLSHAFEMRHEMFMDEEKFNEYFSLRVDVFTNDLKSMLSNIYGGNLT